MREPQQAVPVEQHEEDQQEEPRRKGFFSRVMGLQQRREAHQEEYWRIHL